MSLTLDCARCNDAGGGVGWGVVLVKNIHHYTGTNIVGSHVLYVSENSTVYYECTDTARAVNDSTSYTHCMFTLFVN